MSYQEKCNVFCDPSKLKERIIWDEDEDILSFVSDPWFRPDHCLVIPRQHANELYEVNDKVLTKMFAEAAILGHVVSELNGGYGSVITQKFQPRREEGRIKQNHVHVHAWPRYESDTEEVPFPVPTSLGTEDPNGFKFPSEEEIIASRDRMRGLSAPLR